MSSSPGRKRPGRRDPARREGGGAEFAISMVKTAEGLDNHTTFFRLTGALSSFLDNAPTCLVFFNAAGGMRRCS